MDEKDMVCFDAETIAGILALDRDDPRRRHVDTCPRCASTARLYRAFLDAESVGDDDGRSAARALASVVRRLANEAAPRETFPLPEPARRKPPAWREIRWRHPALGMAAVALMVAAGLFLRPVFMGERVDTPRALRGLEESPEAPKPYPTQWVVPADGSPVSAARLSWAPATGADAYIVELRSEALELVARLGPAADTTLVVERAGLPEDAPRKMLWRVIRLRGGDETSRSRVMRLAWPDDS